jgi:hypothetical protein
MLNDKSYNLLKKSATVLLPAAGALYFALAQIWDLPKAEQVVGSIAAVNTFLGVVLGLSTRAYNKSDAKYDGSIEISDELTLDGPKQVYSLILNEDTSHLGDKKSLTFKMP